MEKLRLPIIRGRIPQPKSLSMDDYLKFVNFNLRYTLNKKAYRQSKRMMAVDVPFKLR
ncbi:MAG: hypothetical protein ISS47_09900 [Candidatus Omnitrophica bacterium]|nr:hypothetical protein [Candidatus Omnitrophota bacterium]